MASQVNLSKYLKEKFYINHEAIPSTPKPNKDIPRKEQGTLLTTDTSPNIFIN